MSKIVVNKTWTLGLTRHTHTSYKIFRDEALTDLIIENLMDSENLLEWQTPIPLSDGTFYNGPYPIYGAVMLTGENTVDNEWYATGPCAIRATLDPDEKYDNDNKGSEE